MTGPRVRALAALALPLVLLAAACAAEREDGAAAVPAPAESGDAATLELVRAALPAATPRPDAAAPVVAGMDALAHELAAQLAAPDRNVVLSPVGVATAFAMARAGARGETAAQLDAVLHLPSDGLGAGMRALEAAVVTQEGPPPRPEPSPSRDAQEGPTGAAPVVALANALFAAPDLAIEEAYLATLAAEYDTGVHQVDFAAPNATDVLDAWADEQTAGRIARLFDQLDPQTRMVLANAVYLKADWLVPFAEEPTTDEPFARADGSRVEVPTMHSLSERTFATGDTFEAVELPYVGDDLAMWVLVPTGDATPLDLLAPDVLAAVEAGAREGFVELALPRWDVTSNHDLATALQALGLTAPFAGDADFSGVSAEGLFVSDAVQRATITVDEWGTEAAAVTGLSFATSGPPPPDAVITADRPFAFVLRHVPTGAPLFVGQVADPSAD